MRIRTVNDQDAEAIADIYAPFVSDSTISFEIDVPSTEEMARRINETRSQFPWLVAEAQNQIVGYAYASSHRSRPAYQWSCDVSIYLSPLIQRRGIGQILYKHLLELLCQQGYASAYAGIALPNESSIAFHKSMGFKPIGVYPRVGFKGGKWLDVAWWHKQIQLLDSSPKIPTAFADLVVAGLEDQNIDVQT